MPARKFLVWRTFPCAAFRGAGENEEPLRPGRYVADEEVCGPRRASHVEGLR
jgi:hypothetical protein